MKKLALAALLLALTLNFCIGEASSKDLATSIMEGVVAITTLSIKSQIALYTLCIIYYGKFNRWPSDRKEFEEYFLGSDKLPDEVGSFIVELFSEKSQEAGAKRPARDDMKSFFNSVDFNFTPLKNGDMLIEGGFNEKMSEMIKSAGMGRCRFSAVARKTDEGFSFLPSEKSKNDRDFLSFPMHVKAKKSEDK